MSETATTVENSVKKTPLQQAVEDIIRESKTETPEEKLQTFRDAGILDKNGQLKEPYVGIDRLIHKAS